MLVGCRTSWQQRVESVRALRGVRVEGEKLAEFLEPRMLLLLSSARSLADSPATKACAAMLTSDGYGLTAAHAVARPARATRTAGAAAPEGGDVRVVWRGDVDDGCDLALIHVAGLTPGPGFALARPDAAAVGTRAVLGGYPGGAVRIALSGGEVTGVAARAGEPGWVTLEHSAAGQEGDSGGPVIDAQGRLLGVTSGGYWSPVGGWRGVAHLPDPVWLARTIEADRRARR
ncbi:MAG: trypsin-like peptidase domain-containing protein [Planctomycetes bacterium]|nr:trypsin-like peptidase domain-containing protein [Planctomycetota bacterium]